MCIPLLGSLVCSFTTLYTSLSLPSFFYSYVGHLDLHSFPTRRSSDLIGCCSASSSRAAASISSSMVSSSRSAAITASARSEEHTSELQSLTNLVCRLLLEKKNKHTDLVCCIRTCNIHNKEHQHTTLKS